jgi:tape measure domain-containing protein|nr:MAG TPA: Tail tape measure [Caudoviricetes sp.]
MEVRNSIHLDDGMSPVLSKILASLRLTLTALNSTPGEAGLFRAAQRDISRANQLLNGFNSELKQSQDLIRNLGYRDDNPIGNVFSRAMNPLTELVAGVYLLKSAIDEVGKLTTLGDNLMLNQARLNIVNDGLRTQEELSKAIYESAQRSRADYLATSRVIGRMGILARQAFNNNDELIAFIELVNKAFLVGGSTQQEQRAAMYQLTQAMASGRLQGDEMRTIRESAPLLKKAIQNYMGLDDAAFKEAQKNGEITAEVIKNAVFASSDEIQNKFNEIPITFSQAMTMAGNSLLTNMEDIFTGISTNGVSMIQTLVSNFDILAGILGYIAGVSLVILIRNLVAALPAAAALALSFIAMNWQVLLLVAAVMALFKLFLAFPEAFGVLIGGVKALGTAFMNMVKLVADYFLMLFNEIILRGMNFVLDKLGKEKIQNVEYFGMESVGLSYLEGYSSGKKWAEDTGVKLDNFMTGMKNTFNPNTSVLGGTVPKPVTDLDTVGEVKNIKGGKINLDDNSIQWIKDAGAIEFVNRFTNMRPILKVNFGDVHQTADVNEIADAIADMVENAVTTSLEGE